MAGDAPEKVVSDPVHGSIPLSKIEVQVMQTQVFQRLRRVKQLGLAHYVYPSADYSRLSHSLGVCHISGLLLDSLARVGVDEARNDWQLYRLAALLHDVGHYPLSHCTEHAVRDYYRNKSAGALIKRRTDVADGPDAHSDSSSLTHEHVSKMVLLHDLELRGVLTSAGFDPVAIASIFLREATPVFHLSNLISSDLDADRFDYLLRSARATGLPYGSIDFTYLLGQLVPDQDGIICVSHKGMRAAEHFLLCRYFDYQQVVFHKVVVGMEQVAQQVIGHLLNEARLDYSRQRVQSAIESDSQRIKAGVDCWLDWDDESLMSSIIKLGRETSDRFIRLKTACLIERRPPVLVVELKLITPRDDERGFPAYRDIVKRRFYEKASALGIDPAQCIEWSHAVNLTSVASKVPVTGLTSVFDEELEKSVRIVRHPRGKSMFLFEEKSSLIYAMGDNTLRMFRLYVVAEPDQTEPIKLVSRELESEFTDAPW